MPVLTTDAAFKQWQKDIYKFVWRENPRVKYKALQLDLTMPWDASKAFIRDYFIKYNSSRRRSKRKPKIFWMRSKEKIKEISREDRSLLTN